jgi:hypothetical protein
MHIVDRRLNPGGKSLPNRQRFLRRVKDVAQRAVRESAREKDIKDLGKDGRVSVPVDGVREPRFSRQPGTGLQDHILPGNKTYVEGDTIERPPGGGGGRGSGEGGEGGENSEDAFRFVLTREEFLELFLEDLELPDLAKRRLAIVETEGLRRAGVAPAGRSRLRGGRGEDGRCAGESQAGDDAAATDGCAMSGIDHGIACSLSDGGRSKWGRPDARESGHGDPLIRPQAISDSGIDGRGLDGPATVVSLIQRGRGTRPAEAPAASSFRR